MQMLGSMPVAFSTLVRLQESIGLALEGKSEVVDLALVALLAGGHLLVEDVPGVGKTTLARALAKAVSGDMRRVQFTSDLLPTDVLGGSIFDQRTVEFTFRKGPIFTNILLADEINRASPRTQSALLEAMNEGQVSIDGQTLLLPNPFFVIATQNAHDCAGTYPLPESQLDRFMLRIRIGYPPIAIEGKLLEEATIDSVVKVQPVITIEQLKVLQHYVRQISIESSIREYILAIVTATRSTPTIALGLSTRSTVALGMAARAQALLRGRDYVLPEDVLDVAIPAIAHRIRPTGYAEGFAISRDEVEAVVRELVARIPLPL